jgi:hypothetical protein
MGPEMVAVLDGGPLLVLTRPAKLSVVVSIIRASAMTAIKGLRCIGPRAALASIGILPLDFLEHSGIGNHASSIA